MSTRTVRNWIKEHKLGSRRIGHKLIITGSQLDAFADERLRFWLFGDTAAAHELDPAYVPPEVEEVDIDTLTDEQLLSAYILIPTEWQGNDDIEEYLQLAKLAGLVD